MQQEEVTSASQLDSASSACNEETAVAAQSQHAAADLSVVEAANVEEEERCMMRADSMFSPQILQGNVDSSFPVVQDETIHEPPADLKAFFSTAPKKGKYLELIQQLLRPPRSPASPAGALSSNEGPTSTTDASNQDADAPTASYLSKEIVYDICQDVTATFQEEKSLLRIDIEKDETLVIVGDVHGQLHDMTHHVLNQQYEKPAEAKDRKFLFLGDYVDRGPQGVEIILLLFALKIEYPTQIFLLRGNHEESQTSRIYGFLYEVRLKFNDLSIWARFNEVFCYLPLAALVSVPGHRLFAVHGGLSPSLSDVNAIEDISRVDYGGMLDTSDSDIVDGLLWSDPSDAVVRFSRNERGCGYLFGAAAVNDFCEHNGIDFICRAHQMTMQGYSWIHSNKVLTVFSAPNYCGMTNNLAAILLINHEWELNFVQFSMAPNRQAINPPAVSFGGVFSYFQ